MSKSVEVPATAAAIVAPEWLPAGDAPVFAIIAAAGDDASVILYLNGHRSNPDNRTASNVPRASVANRLASVANAVIDNRVTAGTTHTRADGTTFTGYPAAWKGANVPATVTLNPRDIAAGKVTAGTCGGGAETLAAAMAFATNDDPAVADSIAAVVAAMTDDRAVAAVTAIGKVYHLTGYGSTRGKR